jgi:6-phosphogluconolactonase
MAEGGCNLFSSIKQKQENDMIHIYNDLEELSQAAAELFVLQSRLASMVCGRFSVALSGGVTPRRMYELLAEPANSSRIHWEEVHVFWSDERCVPADDPRSNSRMAREALLDHVPIPIANIHRINCEQSPSVAAAQYEQELKEFFSIQNPNFHLVLLGLGTNGHTASLFPHTKVLSEQAKWVSDVYVAELGMYRVTFTADFINRAGQVVFLVSGAEKAQTLADVLEGPYQPDDLPAQLIKPDGKHPLWLVDRAAGHKLEAPEGAF